MCSELHYVVVVSFLQNKSSADAGRKWHTVGIFKGLTHTVSGFIPHDEWNLGMLDEPLTSDNLPDLSKMTMTNLEPGTAYRFRLAAINSCGVGEFGDVSFECSSNTKLNFFKNIFFFFSIFSRHRSRLACLVSLVHRRQ